MIEDQKKYSLSIVTFLMLQLLMEFRIISNSAGRPALIIGFVQFLIVLANYKYIINSFQDYLLNRSIKYLGLLTVFISMIFFSANYALLYRASIRSSVLFSVPLLLLAVFVLIDRDKEQTFNMLLKPLIAFGLFISIYGLVIFYNGQFDHRIQYITIGNIQFTQIVMGVNRSRISSITSNPNVLGNILMYTIMSNVLIIIKRKNVLFYLLTFLLQFWVLLLTESRASILGLMLMVVSFTYILSSRKAQLLALVGTLVGLFVAFSLLVDITLLVRISDGMSGREELWYPLIDSIKLNPLTGIGFGLADRVIISRETHNVYLSMLAELGILGFVVFLGVWFSGPINSLRRLKLGHFQHPEEKKQLAAVCSILLGLLFHQFFETDIGQYDFNTLYWIFLITYSVNALNQFEVKQTCSNLNSMNTSINQRRLFRHDRNTENHII